MLQLEDDRRIVSGSSDLTVKVWDISSGRCLATLSGHKSRVLHLAPLPHSGPTAQRIVSGGGDGMLRIWDTTTYTCLSVHTIGNLKYSGRAMSLGDGRFLCVEVDEVGNNNNSLVLWSLLDDSSGQQRYQYRSASFAEKDINVDPAHIRFTSSILQQLDAGLPFSSEEIFIANYVHVRKYPDFQEEFAFKGSSLWSFPSEKKRRWVRRRGFLLLVHCCRWSHCAERNNEIVSNCVLASSPAFQRLIDIHSLVMMIAKLL